MCQWGSVQPHQTSVQRGGGSNQQAAVCGQNQARLAQAASGGRKLKSSLLQVKLQNTEYWYLIHLMQLTL